MNIGEAEFAPAAKVGTRWRCSAPSSQKRLRGALLSARRGCARGLEVARGTAPISILKPRVLASALAAVLLAACAQPIDSVVVNVDGKRAEFDQLIYLSGVTCFSEGSSVRALSRSGCPQNAGREIRQLFARRSSSQSLKDYLVENGASCRSAATAITCDYDKTISSIPRVSGEPLHSGIRDRFEMTVKFPIDDRNLTPEQMEFQLRRFSRHN